MKLEFRGTRGYLDVATRRHRRHACLAVQYLRRRVVLDCGEDWLGRIQLLRPDALVITHSHPDHSGGLSAGAPCPVYLTDETSERIANYPIQTRRRVLPRRAFTVGDIRLEAFPLEHSTRAPAVGYRVAAGGAAVFYVPDVAWIIDRHEALHGIDLYIGDGAALVRPMLRKQKNHLIGHAPMRTQLTWCRKEGVHRAVFTHCGTVIVEGDERKVSTLLRAYAQERGVQATIAYDGMELVLR